MSRREGNAIIFEPTPPAKCELCGVTAELRPYGPRGESICFECGMKDVVVTQRQCNRVLLGETLQ